MTKDEKKLKRSFTITPDADRLIEAIAAKLGLSKSSVVEVAIRRLAATENVEAKAG